MSATSSPNSARITSFALGPWIWSGETSGTDGFTPITLAVAWTEHMRLGTGVVNAFTRGPAVLAQHAAALQDASGGRYCLGIGSSSNVLV